MSLTAVSLFAGIGGIDLALQRAGVDVTAAVEIDDAARAVLAYHNPNTAIHTDVREVTGDQLRAAGFDPARGILAGGFPCQDLSVAGRRAGMGRDSGTRSALFWEIPRLMDELRPRWVLLENVPGLLSMDDGRAMGAVLGALAHRGYGFAYRVLDAQGYGVPQQRRRVFIVGHLGDGAAPAQILLEPESSGRNSQTRRQAGTRVAALTADGVGTCGADDNQAQAGHLIADVAPTLTSPNGGSRHDQKPMVVTHALTAEGHDASEDGTGRGTPLVPYTVSNDAAPVVTRDGTGTLKIGTGLDIPSAPAVAVPIAMRGRDDGAEVETSEHGDPAFTLRTPGGGSSYPMVATTAVRRLTPRECERLQGFPPVLVWRDDMTRDEFAAAVLASGHVTVDCETGTIYGNRGPGGFLLSEPRQLEGCLISGYLTSTLHLGGMHRQIRHNRLVWIAAHGVPEPEMAICHRNDVKTDNRLANLYLATSEQNSSDAKKTGRYRTGQANGRAKLSDSQRHTICDDYRAGGETIYILAAKYGISKSRVSQIVREDDWTRRRLDGDRVVEQSDSQRYKQCGNAVAVPCVEWIARRLMAHEKASVKKEAA